MLKITKIIICSGLGLFAGEKLKVCQFICIYSGEIQSNIDSYNSGVVQDAVEETYLFTLNSELTIDATKVGNVMRYANHSSPEYINWIANIITFINGGQAIALYACRIIEAGDEILFNYNFNKNFKWIQQYNDKFLLKY